MSLRFFPSNISRRYHWTFGLIAVAALALCPSPASSQTTTLWTGDGDGESWNDGDNWDNGAPSSTLQAQFSEGTGVPTQLEVFLEDGDLSRGLRQSGGSDVLLRLDPGAAVDFSESVLSPGAGPASSAGSLEISGAGTVEVGIITLAPNATSADANQLIFSDGVQISDVSGTWTGVGRFRKNNLMQIESGADVTRYTIWLGHGGADTTAEAARGNSGNHIVVTGEDSILRHHRREGGTTNIHFRIGAVGYEGDSYETAMHNNYVLIQDGGTLAVTTEVGNSNLWVGNATLSRSNYVLVEGTNSRLRVLDGNTTLIGNASGSNLGGNFIEVRNGGQFEASGTVFLRDHDRSGQNDGDNLLVIGPDGLFTSTGNIVSTGGTLRLHETGSLSAALVQMQSGRFEAGGGTFVASNRLEIQDGGTFAIGITGDSSASSFTLTSTADILNGSTFATSIFGAGAGDIGQLNLATGGELNLASGVVFQLSLVNYNPALGDEWTVFTGLTNLIDGDFNPTLADLPSLSGGLEWDLTGFNEDGGWVVAVIPEPGMLALISLASGLLFLRRRKVYVTA